MQSIKRGSINLEELCLPKETGLYVEWKKRNLLIANIESLLKERFNTAAVWGPQRPDNTCEILLKAIDKSGAKFAESKVLLSNYLEMIKESKPRFPVPDAKPTEVIDLCRDDSVTCIVLDDTLDVTASASASQTSSDSVGNRKRKSTESNEDIVIIKSCKGTKAHSESKGKEGSWSIIKEVSERTCKRKWKDTDVEVVLINDDDVIVLDDSFSLPSSSSNSEKSVSSAHKSDLRVTVVDDNRVVNSKPAGVWVNGRNQLIAVETVENSKQQHVQSSTKSLSLENLKDTKKVENDTSNKDHLEVHASMKSLSIENSKDTKRATFNIPQNHSSSKKCLEENTTSDRKTKKSRWEYKRPAHLVQPLVQSKSSNGRVSPPSNIYNPNLTSVEKKTGLRPIVIDGNNIAVSHGKGQFSLKGIQICINYFEKRGHRQIKAFLPHYRRNPDTHELINQMEKQGTVVITPSRRVDGKVLASYDDRFIVQYASEVGGVIVSTDNYRDLLNQDPKWDETIKYRLLMFTWVDDLLMFPQDPLGRSGPTLDQLLKF